MTTGNDWLDQARRLVAGLGQSLAAGVAAPGAGSNGPTAADGGAAHGGTAHGGDCRWCPLCQAVAVLRGERPEVTAALADTLSAAAAALRTLAAEPSSAEPSSAAQQDAGAEPDGAPAAPAPVVQHIEIA